MSKKIRKENSLMFPYDAFHGAKISEFVASFNLSKCSNVFENKNAGIHRDNGFCFIKQIPVFELDSKIKHIKAIFKKYGLSITIQIDLYVVSYLGSPFDLKISFHRPYEKSNNDPICINIESNNHVNVKTASKNIERRPSLISSSQKVFQISIKDYQNALRYSWFK